MTLTSKFDRALFVARKKKLSLTACWMTWTSTNMNDELKQLNCVKVIISTLLIEISCSNKMSNFLINSINIQAIIVNNNDRYFNFNFNFSFVIKTMFIKIINIHNNFVINNSWNINNSIIDLLIIKLHKNISQSIIKVKTINF